MKTIKQLATEIAMREGKKSQARIGDIREILTILSDLSFEDAATNINCIYANGLRRAKRRKK